ncbi:MAG: hypothetical protein IT289_07770 [Oligoflexia bacterium]|nr:hypothetical protein [Oligoflexia bacterium]
MKALRLITTRQPENGNHDFDLRGLGNDALLKESFPIGFLSCNAEVDQPDLLSALQIKSVSQKNTANLIYLSLARSATDLPCDLVRLLGLAKYLHGRNTRFAGHLGVLNRTRTLLAGSIREQKPSDTLNHLFDTLHSLMPQMGLTLDNHGLELLKVGGFSIPIVISNKKSELNEISMNELSLTPIANTNELHRLYRGAR